MHAIRQYEFGPPSVLRYEEVTDRIPDADQVRIDVAAAGVHVLDTVIRRGESGGPFPLPQLPMTPGREVAGTVTAVGAGVDRSWLGRPVVAHLGQTSGGYAEQAAVAEAALHPLDGLNPTAAVALIGTGRTTMGLLEHAATDSTDAVLVLAAAGGIGHLVVQWARHAGAFVVGLAGGPKKVSSVLAAGASAAVDYRAADWPRRVHEALAGRTPTLVFDAWGGATGATAAALLGAGGRLVRFGSVPEASELARRGVQVIGVTGQEIMQRPGGVRGLETEALAAAAQGVWTPRVDAFPLADAAAAHTALENRATSGKVVLLTDAGSGA